MVTGVCFYQAYRANQQLLKYYTPTPPIHYRPASTTYSFTDDDFVEPLDPRLATVRLLEQIGVISGRIEELRSCGQAEPASKMQAQLERILANREGPYPVDGKLQLHAIGVYDGGDPKDRVNQIDGHAVGDAHVHVRYQGASLVLGLCAYDPVRWIIQVEPGVQIKKVVVGGYYQQQIQGLPADTPVEGQVEGGRDNRYAFYADTPVEAQAAGVRFRELTGLVPTTIYTTHEYRGSPFVVGPGDAEWTATMTLHALNSLYWEAVRERRRKVAQQLVEHSFPDVACVASGRHGGFATSFATHSVFGPYVADMQPLAQATTQFAVDPRGPSFFGWSSRGIVTIDPKTGEVTPWPIAGIQASHFGAKLAFDTRRNRLLVWGQELWAVDILHEAGRFAGPRQCNSSIPNGCGRHGLLGRRRFDLYVLCTL